MKYLLVGLTALVFTLLLDVLWIGGVAINFYRSEIGGLLSDTVNWPAAASFYVFYVVALVILVLKPALEAASFKKALLLGAVFGFAAYMTYDLTNLATTRGWTLAITLVDIAWGTLLTILVSGLTYGVTRKLFKKAQ